MRRFECYATKTLRTGQTIQSATGAHLLVVDPYRDTNFRVPHFRHDRDETIYFSCHPLVDDVTLDGFDIHGHIVPTASGNGNAYFYWQYVYFGTHESIAPALVSWTTGYSTVPLVVADQYKTKALPIATVAAPAGGISSSTQLLVLVTRLGTNPLDTYSTNKTDLGTAAANIALFDLSVRTIRR
jgi:hypothetical protein